MVSYKNSNDNDNDNDNNSKFCSIFMHNSLIDCKMWLACVCVCMCVCVCVQGRWEGMLHTLFLLLAFKQEVVEGLQYTSSILFQLINFESSVLKHLFLVIFVLNSCGA